MYSGLEPEARALAEMTSRPPFIHELSPDSARALLEQVQQGYVDEPAVDTRWVSVPSGTKEVLVRLVRPADVDEPLPVLLYVHGGGWVLGSASTHDRLVRNLAVGAGCAVAFVDYDRAPEAHYPVALEQCYATARWITAGNDEWLDPARLAVAGDSVGGNMATALTLLAKERGDVRFVHQSLFYPVTDAAQDTASFREFAGGPYLRARSMAWFWHSYLPDPNLRTAVTVSPLRATPDELATLPEALLIVGDHDVLRDEGEAYARRLAEAGVRTTSVRYNGTLHDFMMLEPLRATAATTAAVEQAAHVLRKALWGTRAPSSTEQGVNDE